MPQNTEVAAMDAMSHGAEIGDMPQDAAVAMAYIPMQRKNSKKYEPKDGLAHGTLFPGLDLPFKNDWNVSKLPETPADEVRALGFAIHELGMYLDTHKEDKEALELFNMYVATFNKKRREYTEKYGPLNMMEGGGSRYSWTDAPWPWDLPEGRK